MFSDGFITVTVSFWVHLSLASNLSKKFKILLQDSFSWHPATTTLHLSRKYCTMFQFQNVLYTYIKETDRERVW